MDGVGDRWDSLAGAGFAIYDPDDNLILKLGKPLELYLSRAVAEYSALKEGLMAAYDLGIRNVSGLGIVLFTITQPGALTTVSWQGNYHVPFGSADVFVRLSIQPRAECT